MSGARTRGFWIKEIPMPKLVRLCLLALLPLTFFSTFSYGAQPLDDLKGPIDEVIRILRDPRYQDKAGRELQREKMWNIIQEVFDFTEMAKRTLARNWKKFTPAQRKEFSELFAEFLGNNYIDKIQGGYQEEQVVYLGQKMVTAKRGVVKTKILRESLEIPVAYSMVLRGGVWRVYDVNIEGVSLVKNYRTQFRKALMRKSPAQLIEILRKKIERQKKARATRDDRAGGAADALSNRCQFKEG